MVAKAVHLFEGTKLSSSVSACCCVTIKYLTFGTSFKVFFSFPPYIKLAGPVESWYLECRSDQLSVLFRRRKYKAEAIYLLKRKKGFSTYLYLSVYQKIEVYIPLSLFIRWDKDMFWQPKSISIRRSRSSSAGTTICSASRNQYLWCR